MKTKITAFSLLLFLTIFSSCKKEEANPTENFVGIFKGTSTCNAGAQVVANITKSSKAKDAVIITMGSDHIDATVNGNSISLPNQTTNGVSVNGSGSINGGSLTINMNMANSGIALSCTFSGTNQ